MFWFFSQSSKFSALHQVTESGEFLSHKHWKNTASEFSLCTLCDCFALYGMKLLTSLKMNNKEYKITALWIVVPYVWMIVVHVVEWMIIIVQFILPTL